MRSFWIARPHATDAQAVSASLVNGNAMCKVKGVRRKA